MGIQPIRYIRVLPMSEQQPNAGGKTVEEIEKDRRAAYMTWDALEWSIVEAVQWNEMEAAAEYAEALFIEQSQVPDWFAEYKDEISELTARDVGVRREQRAISWALEELQEWAEENDHAVAEWFERVEGGGEE